MTALTPHEVDRIASRLRAVLDQITTEYRWVHTIAYGSSRRGETLEGSMKHPSGPSDPTGGIVSSTDKLYARRALIRTTDALTDALAEATSARYSLTHALVDREPAPAQIGRSMLTRAQLAESRAAKSRREDRGEGWGDG